MEIDLTDRTAVVTGSTAGIGEAIARALARAGANVVVNGRTQERVDKAVDAIGRAADAADRVRGVAADVGTAEGCAALIEAEPDVDVLVNNAGIFEQVPVFDISDEDWTRFFDVNVMSGVRLARHHTPRMVERGWGRVIFISSESAVQIPAEMVHYGMTKTAQLAVARGLAETTAGTGVTVNSVLPGPTASEGVSTFVAQMAEGQGVDAATAEREFFATARPSSLLQRFATPDEAAAMIVYACSARASATNGAALRVDGGVIRAVV